MWGVEEQSVGDVVFVAECGVACSRCGELE